MSDFLLSNLPVLITVEGIIVAGLLVWGQFWMNAYEIYNSQADPVWHISLAIGSTYLAILASLASISFGISNLFKVGRTRLRWMVILGIFSFFVIVAMVAVSAFGTLWKAYAGHEQWHPLFIPMLPDWAPQIVTGTWLAILVAVVILGWFWWSKKLTQKILGE